jgi:prepilin-type N-terminal cleavage/methylation domain-containing protein
MNTPPKKSGFSLIEVVVAVGIFAIAIVSVIGLLAPISKSVVDIRDGDYAARLITLAQSQIQQVKKDAATSNFDTIKEYLNTNPSPPLYASKDGSKLGLATDPIWTSNAEKFFKITLTRNDTLSPPPPSTNDATAGFLAFNMTVTWTVYNQRGDDVATPQLSTLIIPSAITR